MVPPRKVARAAQVGGLLARCAVRGQAGRDFVRSLAAYGLDLEFEATSPLPTLPASFLGDADEFVTLPANRLMRSGNQNQAGLLQLVVVARAARARRIFEIGTYNGLTALTLAINLPDAVVDTLDLDPGTDPVFPLRGTDVANNMSFERRLYEGTPYANRIVQHLGDSASFDYEGLGGPYDLVYVDGAHSWAYVENDTRAALSIVKSEGAVVWDDYWRLVPDVPGFLHTISDRTLYRIPGTRLAVWLGPDFGKGGSELVSVADPRTTGGFGPSMRGAVERGVNRCSARRLSRGRRSSPVGHERPFRDEYPTVR